MLRQPVRERFGQDELDDMVDADAGQASQVLDLRQHRVAESDEPPVPGPNPASHTYARCIPVAREIRGRRVSETTAGLRKARNPASRFGGAEGSRTPDPKTASLVLSQLSYSPTEQPRYRPVAGVVKEGRRAWYRGRDLNPHALAGTAF
jgi:hypothetical protein